MLGVRETRDRPPFEDWRGAVDVVADQAAPGDVVITTPRRAVHAIRYYADRHDAPELALSPGAGDLGDPTSEQVWVLSRRACPTSPTTASSSSRPVADYGLAEEPDFEGIDLRRYERR